MKRVSLHLGVNQVDNAHYFNRVPRLRACDDDATAMHDLLQPLNFDEQEILLDRQVTSATLTQRLSALADDLTAGDLLVVTYSGHGSQLSNLNAEGEADRLDEVFVLHDRFFLDDEIFRLFGGFADGVRIVFISDSCHSGTNMQITESVLSAERVDERGSRFAGPDFSLVRIVGAEIALAIARQHPGIYGPITQQPPFPENRLRASVVGLSACRDNQEAEELPNGSQGRFTATLLEEIAEHGMPSSYRDLLDRLRNRLSGHPQTPQLQLHGPDADSLADGPVFQ